MAVRLQIKLQEWQQRLESAAKLRSTDRHAASEAAGGTVPGANHSAAGTAVAGFGSSHSVLGDGLHRSSPDSSGSLQAAHASKVQAAIEAAASEGGTSNGSGGSRGAAGSCAAGATPGSSTTTSTAAVAISVGVAACSPTSSRTPAAAAAALATSPPAAGSARAAASEPDSLQPQPRQVQQQAQRQPQKVWRDNPLATPPQHRGSRIKALGLRAAGSPGQPQAQQRDSRSGAEPAAGKASTPGKAGSVLRSSSGVGARPGSGGATAAAPRRLASSPLPSAVAGSAARAEGRTAASPRKVPAVAAIPEDGSGDEASAGDLATEFAHKLCDQLNIHSPTHKTSTSVGGGWQPEAT